MTRHLLLTAWAFAPARTSGVYRAVGIANEFAADGWDVTVLTAPEKIFADEGITDPSLRGQVDDRVQIEEVPFSSGVYSADINRWTRAQARYPELWGALHGCGFPEHGFGDWRRALEWAAENVHRRHHVDLSLGTASPSVDFIPGWHLKRKHGVPVIMDYRDAWTIDVFTGHRNVRTTTRAERWEKRMLDAADQAWFVNEPIRAWHAEKYPQVSEKLRVVPNGFDVVDGASPAVPYNGTNSDRALTFGYVGTINQGQFPAEELLAGWALARRQSAAMKDAKLVLRGHLGRTGIAGAALDEYLSRAAEVGIEYGGPVAKASVGEAYAAFDALVLALASGPGVTSGKVFEFAATGLPVVSVHDPGSAASSIMDGSPVWVPASSMRPGDIAAALIETAGVARAQTAATRAAALEWGAQWERGRQLRSGVLDANRLVKGSPDANRRLRP